MSNIQIPNLPVAIALNGTEQLECVQSGTSVQTTVAKIAQYTAAYFPGSIGPGYTVATLPTGVVGMRAYVTDAASPTFLGTLTGGGSTKCPVFYNGSAWVAG